MRLTKYRTDGVQPIHRFKKTKKENETQRIWKKVNQTQLSKKADPPPDSGELASEFVHTEHEDGSLDTYYRRIIGSFRLEKTLKSIESNHKPNTAKSTTKSCP